MSRDFINNWQQSTQRHSDRKCYELFASSSHSLSCANLKIKMLYLTIWGSFPKGSTVVKQTMAFWIMKKELKA